MWRYLTDYINVDSESSPEGSVTSESSEGGEQHSKQRKMNKELAANDNILFLSKYKSLHDAACFTFKLICSIPCEVLSNNVHASH